MFQTSTFITQGERKTDIKSIHMDTGCARCAQAHPNAFGILCIFFMFVFLN